MFYIYNLLYSVVMMSLLFFEYIKRPNEIRGDWLRQRFGFSNLPQRQQEIRLIWIHAVSMGEVISSVRFIRELKTRYPSAAFLITTVTDTGRKVAFESLSDIADIRYMPFDISSVLKRFLERIRPDVFIAVETELWPNLFRMLKQKKIPVLIMNGRISEKSFRGYKKINFFMRNVLGYVDMFCMQELIYAERIKALGAEDARVRVTGNFKFDTRPPDNLPEWAKVLKSSVIIAGSTHETEEALIIDAYSRLKPEFSGLNLIIAPRHPERFKEVEDLIKKKGLGCLKISEIKNSSFSMPYSPFVVLLDAVGELASAYGVSDIAVIGGSFIRHGGQNPLEAAFWGKPVVCGPYMDNFLFMEDFYKEDAALKTDPQRLYSDLKDLLKAPEKRGNMGKNAKALYNKKAGSINRALEVFKPYYPSG